MYKCYACIGLETQITGAGTAESAKSAEKTLHGLHYNIATPVNKEIFDAIVQVRTENITNNYGSIHEVLKQNLVKLKKSTDISNIKNVLQLKDISLLLSLISAARNSDIDLHLQLAMQR